MEGVEAFSGWSSAQKVAIMTDLINLIEASDLLGFAAGVLIEDYNEILADKEDRNLFGNEPYFLAFQEYIGYLTDYASDHYTEAMIDFVFDEHAEFKNKAHSIYNSTKQDKRLKGHDHFGELSFKHDNEVIPLQA